MSESRLSKIKKNTECWHYTIPVVNYTNSSLAYDRSYTNYSLADFNLRLLLTTETELSAMAAPAIIGSSRKPLTG